MHRAGYAALGLDFAYVPFGVSADLEGALRGMRALGIRGLGVSMPYKLQIIPYLDRLDGLAESIGAVNTVVNDGGTLVGYNTDAAGSVKAMGERLALAGARVLLVGAGGAARAIAFALNAAGAALHIANRTESRAQLLAGDLHSQCGARVHASGLEILEDASEFDLLVNASSAGMDGYGSFPWQPTGAHRRLVVMDAVYKPLQTKLIRACRPLGISTISGERMLLHQAARQFELYTGSPAPLDAMEMALREAMNQPQS